MFACNIDMTALNKAVGIFSVGFLKCVLTDTFDPIENVSMM